MDDKNLFDMITSLNSMKFELANMNLYGNYSANAIIFYDNVGEGVWVFSSSRHLKIPCNHIITLKNLDDRYLVTCSKKSRVHRVVLQLIHAVGNPPKLRTP